MWAPALEAESLASLEIVIQSYLERTYATYRHGFLRIALSTYARAVRRS
jgi:hypothetical protein